MCTEPVGAESTATVGGSGGEAEAERAVSVVDGSGGEAEGERAATLVGSGGRPC